MCSSAPSPSSRHVHPAFFVAGHLVEVVHVVVMSAPLRSPSANSVVPTTLGLVTACGKLQAGGLRVARGYLAGTGCRRCLLFVRSRAGELTDLS